MVTTLGSSSGKALLLIAVVGLCACGDHRAGRDDLDPLLYENGSIARKAEMLRAGRFRPVEVRLVVIGPYQPLVPSSRKHRITRSEEVAKLSRLFSSVKPPHRPVSPEVPGPQMHVVEFVASDGSRLPFFLLPDEVGQIYGKEVEKVMEGYRRKLFPKGAEVPPH